MKPGRALLSTMAVVTLTAVCSIAGCASGGGKATSEGKPMTLEQAVAALSGEWKLASLGGNPIGDITGLGGRVPGFSVSPDGGFSGFGGVNRLASKLDLSKLAAGEFALSPVAVTRMAGPPELMNLEDGFTAALGKARKFSLKDGALSLLDADGADLARLVR